jgi:hypothetical protein
MLKGVGLGVAAYMLGESGRFTPEASAEIEPQTVRWLPHPESGPLSRFTEKTIEESQFIDEVLTGVGRVVDHSPTLNPDWSLKSERALWMGHSGPFVEELQRRLLVDGLAVGAVEGGFGPKTDSALKAFQTAHGVSPTGATDEITWMWLNDWPRPPSQTVGKHILIDDLVKRLWIVDEKGQTRYTGGITNNSQVLATVPFDAGYHTQGLIRIGRAYSENFLPLPYAVPIARDDDGGAFYNREIMLHGFPMSETSQGTFSPIGGGLASLGSTREESHGCIRLSYLGAKIVANASERFGYTTISLRK